jgi:outer membrane receptor protein involved in Fe transport
MAICLKSAVSNRRLRIALLAGVVGSVSFPAAAQEVSARDSATVTNDAAGPEKEQSSDIIVTALKRATSLQETPISISAVTGEALANSGVQSVADLAASVPSLSFVDAGPSQRRVVIRGIQAVGEPTVGVYYDETPVTGSIGTTNDAGGTTPELKLFDVERVEVLRGPQGTLYGSGSMGGTLRIIYAKPSFETTGAGDATISSTHDGGINYEVNGAINAPIVDEKIAVRMVGFYRDRNGYIDNVALGIKDINDEKTYGGRGMVRFTPTPDLTIDAAAYINRSRVDTPSWNPQAGKYNSDALVRQPIVDDLNLYSLTAAWDLGPVVATAIGSYLTRDLSNTTDVSRYIRTNRTPTACAALANGRTPCNATQLASFYTLVDGQSTSTLFPQQDMNTLTGELRLSSSGARSLNWTIGGFFSRRKSDVTNPQVNADPISGEIIFPLQTSTVRFIDDRLTQLAAFGEVSWDITDKLNLTGGARFFNYEKNILGETTLGSILVGARVTPPTRVKSEEHGTVLKFNGSYKITNAVMVYAEAAQGFRPGGANQVLGLDAALTPYLSDSLWNYEVGLKTATFDRKVLFNVDVFQIDWSDMQVTGRTPNGAFSFITNAGAARVKGVEAELTARPLHGLSIAVNGSYIDAKLTENQANASVSAPGMKGDRIPFVAKFSAGANAQYSWPVSERLGGLFRVDVNHVGSSFSDFRPAATFTRKVDSYELVNFRAGIEGDNGRWGAYFFATNLLNDTAITRAASSGVQVGETFVTSAAPRTIGINLRTSL